MKLRNAGGQVVRAWAPGDPNSNLTSSACGSYYYDAYVNVDGLDDAGDPLPDGTYTATATATDSGELAGSFDVQVTLDTRVPAVLTAPVAGSTVSGLVDLVVSPTAGMGVNSVSWSLPGCAWSQSTAAGDGSFRVAQADVSGCKAGAQTLTWSVSWRDQFSQGHSYQGSTAVTVADATAPVVRRSTYYGSAPPVVTLSAPGQRTSVGVFFQCTDGSPVTWGMKLRNAGGQVVRARAPGDPNSNLTSSACGSYYYDAYVNVDGLDDAGDPLPDGTYTATATATDSGELAGSFDVQVTLDTRVPATLTAPAAGTTLAGRPRFEVKPTQGFTGLSQINLSLATTQKTVSFGIFNASADGVWRTTYPMGSLTKGAATLRSTMYWTDAFGQSHTYTSAPVEVAVDPYQSH